MICLTFLLSPTAEGASFVPLPYPPRDFGCLLHSLLRLSSSPLSGFCIFFPTSSISSRRCTHYLLSPPDSELSPPFPVSQRVSPLRDFFLGNALCGLRLDRVLLRLTRTFVPRPTRVREGGSPEKEKKTRSNFHTRSQ